MRKGMFPDLEDFMMPWIGKTMKHIDNFLSCQLRERGIELTRKQVIVLKILFHDGPLPQNDLAFITERDKASLTRFINTLEKRNLVARIASTEDKRVNLIHLTKNGEKVLMETMPILFELILKMQEGVSEKDQQTVIKTMKRIQENIGNNLEGCSNN